MKKKKLSSKFLILTMLYNIKTNNRTILMLNDNNYFFTWTVTKIKSFVCQNIYMSYIYFGKFSILVNIKFAIKNNDIIKDNEIVRNKLQLSKIVESFINKLDDR